MAERKAKKRIEDLNKKSNKKQIKTQVNFEDTLWYQLCPILLAVLAILLLFFYIFPDKSGICSAIKQFFYGCLSLGAWLIPICLIKQTLFWKSDIKKGAIFGNTVYAAISVVLFSVFVHTIAELGVDGLNGVTNLKVLYSNGLNLVGGGVIGGLIGSAMTKFMGTVPTLIVSFAALSVFVIFMIGLTPMRIAELISEKLHNDKERLKRYNTEKLITKKEIKKPVIKESENKNEVEKKKDNEAESPITVTVPENDEKNSEYDINSELDLEQIFVNKENLELTKKMLAVDVDGEIEKADVEFRTNEDTKSYEAGESPIVSENEQSDEKSEELYEYQFPPISFLTKDSTSKTDASDELSVTADKLVNILESFGVKTTVVDVSRGPTVTRYELQPQVGVKVRSIGNLVDDIALHLAAKGAVRIEAPIPGKSAVGIEIPNQNSAMVRLRGLIENPQFSAEKSKLTAVLGEDVAGNPVYMNIASMPHLLIAGATGMGKSVCINSLIISILYKAKPEEVKLILIDPKKVELNMYNGIPHLIVPVVSDPKKAAGSLRWAVTEMERRFQLMDDYGARDIAGFNEIAKIDPELEVLPQIVIIIDELADLMMTAPAEVEDTICRIAQKARAAGMHLVIGTQRPSVDVITGLIKANIPSRIAFTVASQIDSRTIIDIAGAEKLCGKGDMLYAPVGISKPLRVQGSFVSTSEVEKVCEFLKNQSSVVYDEQVSQTIEQEAAKCGVKGTAKDKTEQGDNSDVDSNDELLPSAIELAVELGQNGISTSMLQRRLAIGYARAGRLIDTMEHMNIIGGFEGSKPRRVLITKEQYLEMKMNTNSIASDASSDNGENNV